MGVFVAATHLKLGTQVAVKFLLPTEHDEADAIDRFLREARAAARIESEHVARVTDVATLDSGAPYLVMELLRGTDLGALVKQGPIPFRSAAARIESEHVARVTDVATLDSGAPYLVMELLRGTDLGALVKQGPIPI